MDNKKYIYKLCYMLQRKINSNVMGRNERERKREKGGKKVGSR